MKDVHIHPSAIVETQRLATSRRTVLVLTTVPPQHPGGAEHFVRMLQECLERRGYGVEVLHWDNSGVPWRQWSKTKLIRIAQEALLGYFIGSEANRRIAVDAERIAAVISNGPVGWYPVRGNAKIAHFYHGTNLGLAEAIRPFISALGYARLKWWDTMMFERFNGWGKVCLSNSEQTTAEIQKLFHREASTLWLPLDTNQFREMEQAQCRRELGFDQDGRVGLFVGSMHPQKNFPAVQAVMDAFTDVRWVLALRGEIPERLLRRSDLRIFQDASHTELPRLYNAADFFLCPSRYEPFGYVVAESLACGTPAVATPGGASRLFMEHTVLRPLFVQNPDNLGALKSAVAEVVGRPEYYRRLTCGLRPEIEEKVGLESWCDRFCGLLGL